jgi:DNA-binding NarL/FixJ family response regulator
MAVPPDNPLAQQPPKLRVLVVENHRFFRENLVTWLSNQDRLECCGEAETAQAARRAIEAQHPDLVLLDLTLEGSTGFDLLRWLSAQPSHMPVIVLSQHEEQQYAMPALQAGARGYVSKTGATDHLATAITAICSGHLYTSGRGAFQAVA